MFLATAVDGAPYSLPTACLGEGKAKKSNQSCRFYLSRQRLGSLPISSAERQQGHVACKKCTLDYEVGDTKRLIPAMGKSGYKRI